MNPRKSRTTRVTLEEAARDQAIRDKYRDKPSLESIVEGGQFLGPIPHGDDLAMMDLLGKLKALREKRGLSLADVSDRSGMDRSAISRLENGFFSNPTLRTIETYARAVGANVRFVVEEESDETFAATR